MGYKQELKRNFTPIEVFGIAFSIIGLLPSIASTLSFSLPAGPGGMVWSWFLASGMIFIVGLAMADLASSMPTSGGLYCMLRNFPVIVTPETWVLMCFADWTHYYSSPKTRNYLCFLVGYSNSLGLIGGLCSIDYGAALMFLSLYVRCHGLGIHGLFPL
jgi:amino acid transporter